MKQFFKFFFASLLGSLVSFFVLSLLSFFILIGIVSMIQSENEVSIPSKTILELSFNHPIPERSHFGDFDFAALMSKDIGKVLGLNDILANIKKAKDDKNIAAIYLKLDNFNEGSYATIEPIRNALIDFKDSGKPIIAHGNYISQKAYYLASVADTVCLTPTGYLEFKGLNSMLSFFKKTLEKLEIDVQVIKVGKFKSAVEPFLLDRMSNANREQITAFMNSVNNYVLGNIAEARKLDLEKVKTISGNMLVRSPQDALKYNLVDKLAYEVDVLEILKTLTGKEKIKTVNLKKYNKVKGNKKSSTKDRIAVIYAVGEITGNKGSDTEIGVDNIVKAIRKARNKKSVKAIVMRVNSPGGSALVSDLIWKEVELAKKEKPFVVSFGKYAASGGYYISCGADKIFSEPTTLTGSIGVFALIPNMQKFFNNKLGIYFDGVKTGKYSDFVNSFRPLTANEKSILQKQVNTVYKTFAGNVASGRKMKFDDVDKIGQGRIWSGLQGKEIGLVDEIGGLNSAIEEAKNLAGIEEYRLIEYPEIKDPIEEIVENIGKDLSAKIFSSGMDDVFGIYSKALQMVKSKRVQARLPFEIEIN